MESRWTDSTWSSCELQVDYAHKFGWTTTNAPGVHLNSTKYTWSPVESTWNMWGKVKSWFNMYNQTTVNSKYWRKHSCVIDPSTTVLETMPSMVRRPLAEKQWPCTNTPFFTAWMPVLDRPRDLAEVLSSFETSSKKPSCSDKYWAIWWI